MRMFCTKAVLCTLALACSIVSSAAPQMTTPGGFSVSPRGEATYSIDIQVPPGIVALQPSLTLMYSSDSGNGRLGVDWNLGGTSEIHRCPQTRAQDGAVRAVSMDASDRLCIDGMRLVIVAGTYGAEGSEYRTEIDGFSKIIAHTTAGNGPAVSNGPAWFEVWTKAGQYKTYGNSTDSRVLAVGVSPSTARVWALNRVQDLRTNYMTYTYTQDSVNGDYYLTQINYTGNTAKAQAPTNQITFLWATRPDIVTVYQGGAQIKGTVRLTDIKTYTGSGATAVRDYKLAYGTSPTTDRSEITSITECAATGLCLPATSFTWTNHVKGMTDNSAAISGVYANWSNHLSAARTFVADVNGDGIADIVMGPDASGAWYVMLGTGTGFADKGAWITNTDAEWVNGADGIRVMDVNGDGLADIEMGPDGAGNWFVLLSTGHSFTDGGKWLAGKYANWTGGRNRIYTIDVNGDGLEDLVLGPDAAGNWYVLQSDGTKFVDKGVWATAYGNWVGSVNRTFIADVNGDGLQDIVLGPDGAGSWFVLRSTGTGFVDDGRWITGADAEWVNGTDGIRAMDVNGDGLQDIEMGPDGAGNWFVLLSTGKKFVDAGKWATGKYVGYVGGRNRIYAADTNGDGLQDLIMGPDQSGTWNVLRSNGTSFVDDGAVITGAYGGWTGNAFITHAMDVNGDGLKDMVLGPDGNGNWYLIASNPANERITGFNDGLTALSLTYAPMTSASVYTKDSSANAAVYPIMDAQFPGYVVSSVTSPDGIGGTVTSTYTYGGFKIDLTGRGMLGHRWTNSTRPGAGIVAARSTYTEYNQQWPFDGLVAKSKAIVSSGGNGGLLSQTENTYNCYSGSTSPVPTSLNCALGPGLRYFPYTYQTIETRWDLNGAALPGVTTNFAYDTWGDPVSVDRSTGDGFIKSTANTYLAANTSSWILGRISTAKVTSTSPQSVPGVATLVSVAVTPANPVAVNGSTVQLTATGTYTDGTTQGLTDTVTWTSSATSVATISNALNSSGLATGHALGTTSVTAALGSITSPAVTLTVVKSQFAYVANIGSNTVSQYIVGTNGELTPNPAGATVAAGTQSYSIAVDATAHYVYVGNYSHSQTGSVSQYTIGANGSLTPMSPATVATQKGPNGVTVDPSNHYVYVANYDSASVSQYTIGASGGLSLVGSVAAGTGTAMVAINPANTVAYALNYAGNSVSVFTIGAGGALTLASTTNLGSGTTPNYMAVDPTGKYAYVTNTGTGTIAQFTIGASGALTPMSTPLISVGGHPAAITLDRSGTYVYVSNSGTNSVSQFSIGPGGALALVSSIGGGSTSYYMSVDPTGQFVYVSDRGAGTISQYTVGAGGLLTPMSTPTVVTGTQPCGVVTTREY